jgi:hypothetical protein
MPKLRRLPSFIPNKGKKGELVRGGFTTLLRIFLKRENLRVTSPPDWGFKSHSRALLKKIF